MGSLPTLLEATLLPSGWMGLNCLKYPPVGHDATRRLADGLVSEACAFMMTVHSG